MKESARRQRQRRWHGTADTIPPTRATTVNHFRCAPRALASEQSGVITVANNGVSRGRGVGDGAGARTRTIPRRPVAVVCSPSPPTLSWPLSFLARARARCVSDASEISLRSLPSLCAAGPIFQARSRTVGEVGAAVAAGANRGARKTPSSSSESVSVQPRVIKSVIAFQAGSPKSL